MKKLVIFDWDGVIADSCASYFNFYREIARFFGKPFPPESVDEFRAWYDSAWENNFLRLGFSRDELKKAKEMQQSMVRYESIPLFPSMKRIITELSSTYLLAIASTTHSRTILKKLESEGLDSCFSFISGGEGGTSDKREIISRVLRELDMRREDSVVVGDTVMDIVSAKATGIRVIGVTYGWHPERVLAQKSPDYLAQAPGELPRLLKLILQVEASKRNFKIIPLE